MKSMSVKLKITLWFAAFITAILAAALVLFMSAGSSVLTARAQRTLQQLVQDNSRQLEYTDDRRDLQYGYQYIEFGDGWLIIEDDFLDRNSGVYCALFDSRGNLLYGTNIGGYRRDSSGQVSECEYRGRQYYVYSRPLSGNGLDGLIMQGAVAGNANDYLLDGLFSEAVFILPVLAALALAGGYLLAGAALRPLEKITKSAEAINSGEDLSARIDIGEGGDEIHRLARSFNRMTARLERSFEEEKQFTSDISHELRTPVSVILARSESAAGNPKSVRIIRRQALRMKNMLERMLSYSRLARMDRLAEKEEFDISAMCTALREERRLRQSDGIAFHSDIQPRLRVLADEGLMIQAVQNLIDNAFKYGRPGGNIWLSLCAGGGMVYIAVADDGIGIPRRQRDKVFGRFYRVDRARSDGESLGLGLAVTKEIVRLCGGGISLSGRPGGGSVFVISVAQAGKN